MTYYANQRLSTANTLTHHGVKGMKWGVRKKSAETLSNRYNDSAKKEKIKKAAKVAAGVAISAAVLYGVYKIGSNYKKNYTDVINKAYSDMKHDAYIWNYYRKKAAFADQHQKKAMGNLNLKKSAYEGIREDYMHANPSKNPELRKRLAKDLTDANERRVDAYNKWAKASNKSLRANSHKRKAARNYDATRTTFNRLARRSSYDNKIERIIKYGVRNEKLK